MIADIKKQIGKAEAALRAVGKSAQTDMASDALNHVAYYGRQMVKTHIKSVFDNPIPRTINSVIVGTATPAKPEARVFINDRENKGVSPAKYLRTEATGGDRADKRVERALKIAGILGQDQQTYGVDTDSYGNLSGGKITQMLSALNIGNVPDGKAKTKVKWRIARRKADGKPFGIFQMKGVHSKLFMVFTKKQTYKNRFKFYDVVKAAWNQKIKEAWAKAWARHVTKTLAPYAR